MEQAVKDFQHFAGLPITGELDDRTVQMMKVPRCGVRDDIQDLSFFERRRRRRRRYALQGTRWRERRLTWGVTQYSKNQKLSRREVDETFRQAFAMWSAEVSDLDFVQVTSGRPKIEIKFAVKDHGDKFPFDGPGKVLAHGFFPQAGGHLHMDDEETWTLNSYEVRSFSNDEVKKFSWRP